MHACRPLPVSRGLDSVEVYSIITVMHRLRLPRAVSQYTNVSVCRTTLDRTSSRKVILETWKMLAGGTVYVLGRIHHDGVSIFHVTSGTASPTLDESLAGEL